MEYGYILKEISLIWLINILFKIAQYSSNLKIESIIQINSLNFKLLGGVSTIEGSAQDHGFIRINMRTDFRLISHNLANKAL